MTNTQRFIFILNIIACFFATAAYSQQPKNSIIKHTLSKQSQDNLFAQMVWVEGGLFMMGSDHQDAHKHEKPRHKVSLDGFYMAKTEVTQGLFEELMGWNYSYFQCAQCPMNNISWFNAQLFIKRLNLITGKRYQFPTEAQWEYAASGGVFSKGYIYSGSNNINEVAWYAGNAERKSHAVAQKKPNELGLFDMTGNLWEMVLDDMSRKAYTLLGSDNPLMLMSKDPKHKAMKVIRGSGYEFSPQESQVFRRDGATNNVRMPDIGFRLVLNQDHRNNK